MFKTAFKFLNESTKKIFLFSFSFPIIILVGIYNEIKL